MSRGVIPEEVDIRGYEPRHDGNLSRINPRTIPSDGEGLQSPFDRRLLCTAECIQKRRYTVFYLSEDTFSGTPISVATRPESAPEPRRRRPAVASVVSQNRRVGDRHDPSKFPENHRILRFSRRREPHVREFVRLQIPSTVM
jgi:hypothetical protein